MLEYKTIVHFLMVSFVVYIGRFVFDRAVISIKPIFLFYKKRNILPAVKIWGDLRLRTMYNEIFAALEVLIITLLFMLLYRIIPANGLAKAILFFAVYGSIVAFVKLRFIIMLTNYPMSLLFANLLYSLSSLFLQCIMLGMLYRI